VTRLAPSYADVECRLLSGADPVLVDATHPAIARLDQAFLEVEGRRATLVRSGGSLPLVSVLGSRGAAVVLTGIGLPTDGPHAPNERLSIDQFRKGIRIFARFFSTFQKGVHT
jgi:acetylornithine deacetylase/succinyl-diaminopimelate desuccinylase-like protein